MAYTIRRIAGHFNLVTDISSANLLRYDIVGWHLQSCTGSKHALKPTTINLVYCSTEKLNYPYILKLASDGHHVSSLLRVPLPCLHADTNSISQLWTHCLTVNTDIKASAKENVRVDRRKSGERESKFYHGVAKFRDRQLSSDHSGLPIFIYKEPKRHPRKEYRSCIFKTGCLVFV